MKRRIFLLLGMLARWVGAESQQSSIQPNGEAEKFTPSCSRAIRGPLYDAQRPEASKIELTLAANAMKCVDGWLNSKHLKSVQEYAAPSTICWSRTRIQKSISLHPLTIPGTGRPSTVDVTLQENSGESSVTMVQGMRSVTSRVERRLSFIGFRGLKGPLASFGN